MSVEVGKVVQGKVSGITKFGAFVQLPDGETGLVHISEVAEEYVKEVSDHLTENQMVTVKVISVDKNGKISLSIKKALAAPSKPNKVKENYAKPKVESSTSFEDLMTKFMKDSDEKMSNLKKNFESKRGKGGHRKTITFK